MKVVVYGSEDSNVTVVTIPGIPGERFVAGEEVPLTDEAAEIALKNPHVRLVEPAPRPAVTTPPAISSATVEPASTAPASGASAAEPASSK